MEIDKPTLELLNEMGFKPGKDAKLYELKIENGFAYVDFRKVDGRRFAMIKNKPVDDEDSIPILKEFKKRRDEIQNELLKAIGAGVSSDKMPSIPTNKGLNSPPQQPIQEHPAQPPKPGLQSSAGEPILKENTPLSPTPALDNPTIEIFNFLKKLAGNSIVEISGRSGVGKTKLLLAFADIALKSGQKVVFIDSEQNLDEFEIKRLGAGYKFLPTLKEVLDYLQEKAPGGVPNGTDIIFLDSLGAEQNGMWGVWDDTKRNRGLSEISSTAYLLKMWAIKNKKTVWVSNQPKSERGKTEKDKKEEVKDGTLRPMETVGDKHSHIIKTALYLENIYLNKEPVNGGKKTTRSWVKALKCRNIGRGKELFLIDISDDGTKLSAFDKDRLMQYILPSEEQA